MTNREWAEKAFEIAADGNVDEQMLDLFVEHDAAVREECARLCDTYEEWCGNWGMIKNEVAARGCSKEIATKLRAKNA